MEKSNNELTQNNKNGVKVYSIIYEFITEFLGKSTILPKELFGQCKRLNNDYKDKRNYEFSLIYEEIKKAKPIVFKYNEKDLFFFIEYIFNTNQTFLLKYLVVPSQYIGYFDDINEDVYQFYLNSFKKFPKAKKIKEFKEFLIKGKNYKNMIKLLNNIIYSSIYLKKTNVTNKNNLNNINYGLLDLLEKADNEQLDILLKKYSINQYNISIVKKAILFKKYLLNNIYGLKKEKFEKNYEKFFTKNKI